MPELNRDWLSRELDIAAERLQSLANYAKQNRITKDAFEVATGYRMLRAYIIALELEQREATRNTTPTTPSSPPRSSGCQSVTTQN